MFLLQIHESKTIHLSENHFKMCFTMPVFCCCFVFWFVSLCVCQNELTYMVSSYWTATFSTECQYGLTHWTKVSLHLVNHKRLFEMTYVKTKRSYTSYLSEAASDPHWKQGLFASFFKMYWKEWLYWFQPLFVNVMSTWFARENCLWTKSSLQNRAKLVTVLNESKWMMLSWCCSLY